MKYDPQQRPTASQTLQYPYFQAHYSPAISFHSSLLRSMPPWRLQPIWPNPSPPPLPDGLSKKLNTNRELRKPKRKKRLISPLSSLFPLICPQKEALLDGNELSLAPPPSILHDSAGQPRINSTYVNDRLAGEPRQGAPTNIPLAAPNIAPSNPSNDPLHDLGLGSK